MTDLPTGCFPKQRNTIFVFRTALNHWCLFGLNPPPRLNRLCFCPDGFTFPSWSTSTRHSNRCGFVAPGWFCFKCSRKAPHFTMVVKKRSPHSGHWNDSPDPSLRIFLLNPLLTSVEAAESSAYFLAKSSSPDSSTSRITFFTNSALPQYSSQAALTSGGAPLSTEIHSVRKVWHKLALVCGSFKLHSIPNTHSDGQESSNNALRNSALVSASLYSSWSSQIATSLASSRRWKITKKY